MDVGCSDVQVVDDLRIIENFDERTSSAQCYNVRVLEDSKTIGN